MKHPKQHALKILRDRGGTLRTKEILSAGIHPRTLYAMRDAGELEALGRGLFRLSDLPPLGEPDLITVAKRIPQAVLCLISALAFHHLTTQVPHRVQIALPRSARHPRLRYPPIEVFRFSEAFDSGIEIHSFDRVNVRVYSAEKSLAHAFKYRNKIGTDVAVEALRAYLSRRKPRLEQILNHARASRVERVMRPYLEAVM
jgi:predicted transcriptional regulator of viral defense system